MVSRSEYTFPVIAGRVPLYVLDIDSSGFWTTIKVVYSRPYKRGLMKGNKTFSAMGYEKITPYQHHTTRRRTSYIYLYGRMIEGIPNFEGRVPLRIIKSETGASNRGYIKFLSSVQLATPEERFGTVTILYSRQFKPKRQRNFNPPKKFDLIVGNTKFYGLILRELKFLEDGRSEMEFEAEWWETIIKN